jgi:hypothetical protein
MTQQSCVTPDKPRSGAIRGPFIHLVVVEWTPAFAGEANLISGER